MIAVLIVALLVGNILNAAADLMAIGQGMQMLGAGPDHLWSAVAGVGIAVALMSGSFAVIAKVFKWLCVTLLAYVAVLFVANVNWPDVLEGLLGLKFSFAPQYLGLIVASWAPPSRRTCSSGKAPTGSRNCARRNMAVRRPWA